jgi:hypothetical protein
VWTNWTNEKAPGDGGFLLQEGACNDFCLERTIGAPKWGLSEPEFGVLLDYAELRPAAGLLHGKGRFFAWEQSSGFRMGGAADG